MYLRPVNIRPLPKQIKSTNTKTQNNAVRDYKLTFGSSTSAGNSLKSLGDMTCAYLGKKMILSSLLPGIEKQLDKASSVSSAIKILSKYKESLLEVEEKMFERFKEFSSQNPKKLLPDYLKEVFDESLTKLKLEELFVLDDMDMISRELSPQTAFSLRKKTTKCRDIILKNDSENTFKRKTLLSSLDEIIPVSGEEKLLEQIKDRAIYLPTSGSSENAFVVKYLNRSHDEIAKRLLRASVQTVEHVVPASLGGPNDMSNFVLASAYANSYRSNMPLTKFIERFPQLPQNCQKYIDDIIAKMNKGKLKGNETYPYDIKRTLAYESKGQVKLDLSNYQYSETEAIKRKCQKNIYIFQKTN